MWNIFFFYYRLRICMGHGWKIEKKVQTLPRCKKNICIIFCLHGITIFETSYSEKVCLFVKNATCSLSEIYNFKPEILFASVKEIVLEARQDFQIISYLYTAVVVCLMNFWPIPGFIYFDTKITSEGKITSKNYFLKFFYH